MFRLFLSLAVALASICSSLDAQFLFRKQARVLTSAWASPEFEERRQTPDGPARLTYHFYQGNFHGGLANDKSLEKLSLQDIVQTLSRDMADQNYYPAESPREGDMLIVVHWGVTAVEEDWDELFPDDGGSSETEFDENGIETGTVDGEVSELSTVGRSSVARNAMLTGIDKGLRKRGMLPSDREDLRSLLDEERYFVILMAYDWQQLLNDKTHELLWSCRFSLPSPGTNFVNAVPSLSRAAAPLMGTNLEDLAKTKTQLGWGKGTVGELEVIGEVDEEELESIKAKE